MGKVKIYKFVFCFFIITINAYSQKDVDSNLSYLSKENIESNNFGDTNNHFFALIARMDSTRWFCTDTINYGTLLSSILTGCTFQRKNTYDNYQILFYDGGALLYRLDLGRIDGELYTKYDPAREDGSGVCFISKTRRYRKFARQIQQELIKGLMVSIYYKQRGTCICKSFKNN